MMHYGESDYWVAHYRSLTEGRAKVLLAPRGHSEDLALHERSVLHAEEEAANAPPQQRAMAGSGSLKPKLPEAS